MKKKLFVISTVVSLLLLTGRITAFNITDETTIVIPQNALESSRLGAREITEYVKKISGKEIKTEEGTSKAKSQIIIGTLETLNNIPANIRQKLESTKNIEAFYISCKGNTLYIIGKKRVAELWGVYTFLEDKLGVRWLKTATKDDPGEYVPTSENISINDFELFKEPAFKYRLMSQCSSYAHPDAVNGKTYAARNKFHVTGAYAIQNSFNRKLYDARTPNHVTISGGHTTFSDAVPPKLFKEHPEYFSMINGKRVLTKHSQKQYCISNPEVQDLVVKYLETLYKKYPRERVTYLFGMVDTTTGWCECDECRKLDETEKFNYHNVSTRFHKVVASIAKRIYKKYPDAQLLTWAYHTYRELPKNVTYDPRINVYYCIHGRCYGHELDDPGCSRNIKQLELVKEWQKINKNVLIYEYSTCTPAYYTPLERTQAKDLKFYNKIGLIGWKIESIFPDSHNYHLFNKNGKDIFNSNWQWLYVTGKMLWNPELNVEELLADAEEKYYGKAYPVMKKYHDLRRRLWDNSSFCMGYPTRDQRRPTLLNVPDSKKNLLAYLTEAENLAGNDKILLGRLAQDKDWLERYWIKPNEELRGRLSKTYAAPTRKGTIKIDGDPDDGEWSRAFYTSDFKRTFRDKEKAIPEDLKTTVGILSDSESLYFCITAMEPDTSKLVANVIEKDGAIWGDDSIELFIMPPSAAQEYFHVAVNSKGVVYDSICPGNDKSVDLDVKAAAKVFKDRYVIEVQVPLVNIGKAECGALWRIHVARNRKKGGAGDFTGAFSLDGVEHHDTSGYRGIVMGAPRLFNGSFDEIGKNGKIKHWKLSKGSEPVKTSNGNAIKIGPYCNIYQLMYINDGLSQSPKERKVTVSLKASGGPGNIGISFLRYTDTSNPKAENGYDRKIHPTENGGDFKLTPKTKVYSVNYTIKPNEWCGLMIVFKGSKGTSALVDDVSLMLNK